MSAGAWRSPQLTVQANFCCLFNCAETFVQQSFQTNISVAIVTLASVATTSFASATGAAKVFASSVFWVHVKVSPS